MQPNVFTPQPSQSLPSYDDDIDNEPPLLEELGIDVGNIWLRMKGIAFFKRLYEEVLRDADLGGPIVIILALGLCLLLAGKLVSQGTYLSRSVRVPAHRRMACRRPMRAH